MRCASGIVTAILAASEADSLLTFLAENYPPQAPQRDRARWNYLLGDGPPAKPKPGEDTLLCGLLFD